MTITAIISQVKGVAAFDNGETIGFLNANEPTAPFYGENLVYARMLQDAPDIECIEVGDLAALVTHLTLRKDREELLSAALILLDGERPGHIRERAAQELSRHRNLREWQWVEGVLVSAPLPSSADPQGAIKWSGPHTKLFAELPALQNKIKTLSTAWNALPQELFSYETSSQVRAKAVRHGVFRNLLYGTVPSSLNPFLPAVSAYARTLSASENNKPISSIDSRWWIDKSVLLDPDMHKIWETAPWRSAWFATEWERMESILASGLASEWMLKLAHLEPLDLAKEKTVFEPLFDSWECVRHNSKISKAVDLIWSLVDPNTKTEQQFYVEIKYSNRANRRFSTLDPLNIIDKRWDQFEHNRLPMMLLEFFDVPSQQATSSKYMLSHGNVPWIPMEVDSRDLVSIAYRAHLQTNSAVHKDAHESLGHRLFSYDLPYQGRLRPTDARGWEAAIRQAIAVFALDKVFRRNGCVVFSKPLRSYLDNRTSERSSVLLNLATRRSRIFEGYWGWILGYLQDRLQMDLESGLPREYCGWVSLIELSSGQNKATVQMNVEGLFEQASNAGFASAFQQSSEVIRLNPEFAAPTGTQDTY